MTSGGRGRVRGRCLRLCGAVLAGALAGGWCEASPVRMRVVAEDCASGRCVQRTAWGNGVVIGRRASDHRGTEAEDACEFVAATCAHLVRGVEERGRIEVQIGRGWREARLVDADRTCDLALVAFAARPGDEVVPSRLAASSPVETRMATVRGFRGGTGALRSERRQSRRWGRWYWFEGGSIAGDSGSGVFVGDEVVAVQWATTESDSCCVPVEDVWALLKRHPEFDCGAAPALRPADKPARVDGGGERAGGACCSGSGSGGGCACDGAAQELARLEGRVAALQTELGRVKSEAEAAGPRLAALSSRVEELRASTFTIQIVDEAGRVTSTARVPLGGTVRLRLR